MINIQLGYMIPALPRHITNNKNILKNFINKKIVMKCANNTTLRIPWIWYL